MELYCPECGSELTIYLNLTGGCCGQEICYCDSPDLTLSLSHQNGVSWNADKKLWHQRESIIKNCRINKQLEKRNLITDRRDMERFLMRGITIQDILNEFLGKTKK